MITRAKVNALRIDTDLPVNCIRDIETPKETTIRCLDAQDRAGRSVGTGKQVAVAKAEEDLIACHSRRAERGQVRRDPPVRCACGAVEANDLLLPVAAPGIQPIGDHSGTGVDVQSFEVPYNLSVRGFEAIHPVLTGAKIDSSPNNTRARFRVTLCGKIPELFSGVGVEAVELAVGVLMKSFPDIESPISNAR
jgi:hypothetical protein